MSLPSNMKTGMVLGSSNSNYLPETFYIIYFVLAAILRRCGVKDGLMYSKHNKGEFNQNMFDSGVLFNLHSEYGVGKSLEPMIYELFTTTSLDPDKNNRNIFFREIIRLTPMVVKIIRSNDTLLENSWMLEYSLSMEPIKDSIAHERILRLSNLLYEAMSDSYDDSIDDSYSDIDKELLDGGESDLCYCAFCHEFRKYHNNFESRNVNEIINTTISNITNKI